MKFDFVIGNPPYQEETVGANANDMPVYHYFYESAFEIADKVELITPARFLQDAGGTPKEWNKKMLSDKHLKVLMHEPKAEKFFSNTSIMGGVAVIYRDKTKNFGGIGLITPYDELNNIVKKVDSISNRNFSEIVSNRGIYRYSDLAYKEQPEEMKKTADRRIAPSSFERMSKLFTENKPDDNFEYVIVYGNIKSEKITRWFKKIYLQSVENLYKYKVFISKAYGADPIGSGKPTYICGKPFVAEPNFISTETYISIGSTDSKDEAEAIAKYIKTKFTRAMLGVKKVTQNNAKPTWEKIPLQDFTDKSDIDWTKSIHDIDKQLYKKYNLSQDEIDFIETNVKEMI